MGLENAMIAGGKSIRNRLATERRAAPGTRNEWQRKQQTSLNLEF
jgi:hypothetical protein